MYLLSQRPAQLHWEVGAVGGQQRREAADQQQAVGVAAQQLGVEEDVVHWESEREHRGPRQAEEKEQ